MYFSRTFRLFLRRRETILTKSSLLYESSVKFAPKCKSLEFLAWNNEVILTWWPLKNTFFTFYKRDSALVKLLNYLDRISLMSLTNIKITLDFYFPRKSKCNCRSTDVFQIFCSYYSFYIIPLRSTDNFLSPIMVSEWLIFCGGNFILH